MNDSVLSNPLMGSKYKCNTAHAIKEIQQYCIFESTLKQFFDPKGSENICNTGLFHNLVFSDLRKCNIRGMAFEKSVCILYMRYFNIHLFHRCLIHITRGLPQSVVTVEGTAQVDMFPSGRFVCIAGVFHISIL